MILIQNRVCVELISGLKRSGVCNIIHLVHQANNPNVYKYSLIPFELLAGVCVMGDACLFLFLYTFTLIFMDDDQVYLQFYMRRH